MADPRRIFEMFAVLGHNRLSPGPNEAVMTTIRPIPPGLEGEFPPGTTSALVPAFGFDYDQMKAVVKAVREQFPHLRFRVVRMEVTEDVTAMF